MLINLTHGVGMLRHLVGEIVGMPVRNPASMSTGRQQVSRCGPWVFVTPSPPPDVR